MRQTERTARKRYCCTFCESSIAEGSRYIDGFWLCEGNPSPWRTHLDCQVMADKFPDVSDGVPPFLAWDTEYDVAEEDRAEFARLVARAQAEVEESAE